MPRLIDAYGEYTLNDCDETGYSLDFGCGFIDVYDPNGKHVCQFWAGDAPTIDPESLRPHGRWVQYDGDSWKCSECGEENCWAYTVVKTAPSFVVQTDRYCPNCGAKMDLEEA